MQVQGNEKIYRGVWQVGINCDDWQQQGSTPDSRAAHQTADVLLHAVDSMLVDAWCAASWHLAVSCKVHSSSSCQIIAACSLFKRWTAWFAAPSSVDLSNIQQALAANKTSRPAVNMLLQHSSITSDQTAVIRSLLLHPPDLQGLMHMARTEGMRGMMKGNWTNCVRIIPNSAMKFFTYEQLSRWAHRQQQRGAAAAVYDIQLPRQPAAVSVVTSLMSSPPW
jgi:hypothetical protein